MLAALPALSTAPALSACGISLRQPTDSSGAGSQRDARRIEVRAAFEAVSAGRAVLVDVRSESAYLLKRAAGAVLVPLDELERSPEAARRVPAGKQPIFYCT